MKLASTLSLSLLLLLRLSMNALADQITLANGDKISGEILEIADGQLRILTEYAGEISVDFARVTDLRIDEAGRISLKNGDTITGRIGSISENRIVITSQAFGDAEVARELFESFERTEIADAERAESEQARELLEQAETDLKEAEGKLAQKEEEIKELTTVSKLWSGSFAVGAQLERGNTDTTDVRVEAKATRKAPREELRLRFYADYGETEGKTDTNKVFGESKLKVFQTDRRYLFGLTNMEYDEMENLDLRAQGFGGLGYNFIDKERTHLLGEVGAGLTGEFFDDGDDEETLEASGWLNSEWKQRLFEHTEFYQALTLYPSLGNFGEYRLRSESTLTTPLSDHWAIKLSLIDDYDTDPESEDVKRNDLRFISSMEYTF
jgi:putative salt-induced outer membrane protein YdiY